MSDSKIYTEIRKTFPWKLVVIFVLFSVAIVVAGIFYYRSQKKRIITEATINLAAIASLKIGQIDSWRKGRVGDAAVIRENRPLIKTIRQFYSDNDKGLGNELTDWMKSVVNEYDYENVLVADTSFRVRLSVNPSDFVLGDSLKREMKSALNDHSIVLTDLHRSKEIPFIHLDILIPLFDSVNKIYIPVGIVVLRIDPNKVLFPLINSWPTSSKSSETLLFRKEKDSILYLNELRLTENTALRLRLPLSNKDLLATKAAKGLIGTAEGVDYRNIPVVGSLHVIPGTHWFMVAKVDKAEILAPLSRYIFLIILIVVLLVLINASIFGFWIWEQNVSAFKKQLENEKLIRKSEEKLHETNEYLSNLFNYANVPIIVWDTSLFIIRFNHAFEELSGYSSNEVIGKKIDILFSGEKSQSSMSLINSAITGKRWETVEIEIQRKDGDLRIVLWNSANILDKDGKNVIATIAQGLDITERKQAENSLKESEILLQSIIDNSNSLIYIVDAEGRFIHVNQPLLKLLSTTQSQLIGQTREAFLPKEIAEVHRKNDLVVITTGKTQVFEEENIEPDGIHFYLTTKFPLFNNQNDIYGVGGLSTDITERKHAEESLRLKNFVFDDSIAANSISDANGILTEVNAAFVRIWGYQSKDEVIGKSIAGFIKEISDANMIVAALNLNGEWEGDYSAVRKDGSTFFAHGLATVVKDENGEAIGYQSAVIDVTDAKRAEELIHLLNEELELKVIQRTELLEAANKELEAFSYSVSHDLRAPLRSVHGFTKILLEDYEASLDEEGKRICRIISSSATQMGELIDDLLSFSRIGRSSLNPSEIDMKKMAKAVFEGMTSPSERKRIKLNIGKLQKAFGDVTLFGQVWTNLISNAIKYSSKNDVSEISIGSKITGEMIIYFIKDNGVGFDMQYSHKLFGVFQRLHSEADFEGNGVGLAIVQGIILKHGGKVWAEGEVGKGATFFFSLPVQDINKKTNDTRHTTHG